MNFIGLNISHLIKKNNLKQNDFADIFGLKQSAVSSYIGGTMPKIETIQRICEHFQISIDNFINSDLSKGKGVNDYVLSDNLQMVAEGKSYEQAFYIVDKLEKSLIDKQDIINLQKQRIAELENELRKYRKDKTKRQAG